MKLGFDEIKKIFEDAGIKILTPEEAKAYPNAMQFSMKDVIGDLFGEPYILLEDTKNSNTAFYCSEKISEAA